MLKMLGDITRERRGQIVAQRKPLAIVINEREYALIRPVKIRKKLPERVGVLEGRRLKRVEAVRFKYVTDRVEAGALCGDFCRCAVSKPPRHPGLRPFCFALIHPMSPKISGLISACRRTGKQRAAEPPLAGQFNAPPVLPSHETHPIAHVLETARTIG